MPRASPLQKRVANCSRLKFASQQCQKSLSCSFFQQTVWGGQQVKVVHAANHCPPFNLSFRVDLKLLLFVACLQHLCGHSLKFKMYFWILFLCHGKIWYFCCSRMSPTCHLSDCSGRSGTFSLTDSCHYSSFSNSYLMEAKQFILKYKLGHDPSRARAPPGDSA